jgi:hypothetical protein
MEELPEVSRLVNAGVSRYRSVEAPDRPVEIVRRTDISAVLAPDRSTSRLSNHRPSGSHRPAPTSWRKRAGRVGRW